MSINSDDHQTFDTLSLNDFFFKDDEHSISEDHHHHRNPPSPAATDQDLFEFCSGRFDGLSEEHTMSHAEDMISGGKLIPINDQPKKHITRRRSESMHELTTSSNLHASQLARNSYSLDYKKLNKNSRLNYEPAPENHRSNLSNKSSSSRWSELVFGPLKGPPEMDLRDIRNRQIVNTSRSLFPAGEDSGRFAVGRVGYHRKSSWGVLGILSCRSSGSVKLMGN